MTDDRDTTHERELIARYENAMHRMQSATAFCFERGDALFTPRHARVGLNGIMADHGALVTLLVEKGVIDRLEYLEAVARGAEREAQSMVERARRLSGSPNLEFA